MAPPSRRDRLERLTNLVLVLLDAKRPLTLREITDQVEGYPKGREATRQAFERDKKALRDQGIPVTNVAIGGVEQVGYVLRPEDYYLPDLDLDPAEAKALAFAVAAVQLGGNAGRNALSTLGHFVGSPPLAPVAVLPALPALATIHEGLRRSAVIQFRYRGKEREVEPYALAFRQAAWYLVGRDRGAGAKRTFRVDRLQSPPAIGEEGAFETPVALDLAEEIRLLPFTKASEDVPVAEVEIDARLARETAALVPAGAVSQWKWDGSVVLRLPVGDTEAFVSFVAGLGDTAVVRGPAPLREAILERLRTMAVPAARRREPSPQPPGKPVRSEGPSPRRPPPSGVVAGERLRRLLAVLVHLSRVGEARIDDLAARFELDAGELVHDLELAACCGVPPYTPDQLIELIVDGDRVRALGLGHLAKPRRLTPEEGFALATAGEALSGVAGAGEERALRSALDKLAKVLGESRFSLEVGQPEHLGVLKEAVESHSGVEIEYVSSATAEPTVREVDPYQVVLREGRWYLDAFCHRAGGARRFSVERVQSVRPTGALFEPPGELDSSLAAPGAFIGGPDAVRAKIAFPPGSELAVEQAAASRIEALPDGRLAVELLVADAEGWFGRLLLRLGPGAEVLSPPELAAAGARAARRALARYER